ncbi:unnamed protein product [Nyctereutes procyonoides]|uniref:(raccoon dog) hypothetical protein n=1 Tax=Nyctereutes procyonoides TaxID=34880 RepID=A0A811ZNK3_NYCPR|nr:unnamed protein product [Nyctereutes procyonoides]
MPRLGRGHRQGFRPPTNNSKAATPSSGSLLATLSCYWSCLGSTSSNSSCRNAEYPGEAIPHPPGLPKAYPGHSWASFFFRNSTLPFRATASDTITCDLAPEVMRKQPVGQPSKANNWAPILSGHHEPPGFGRH